MRNSIEIVFISKHYSKSTIQRGMKQNPIKTRLNYYRNILENYMIFYYLMLGQITFRMSSVLLKRCNLDLQLQNDAVIVIHEFNKKMQKVVTKFQIANKKKMSELDI